jgi:hypothetical protein
MDWIGPAASRLRDLGASCIIVMGAGGKVVASGLHIRSSHGGKKTATAEPNIRGLVSETLETVRRLVLEGAVRVSGHGYDELVADGLSAREVVDGVADADLVEDYPDYPKGPCVLVLQRDRRNRAIHVVWGIPKGLASPAVLVTAYRPAPERWEDDLLRRRR